MKIGILGAGNVALSFAREAIKQGHEIVLSSRHPESLTNALLDLGSNATATSPLEAGSQEIVLLAVPWLQVELALSLIPEWGDRILIDATNPFSQLQPTLVLADLKGQSASVMVAKYASGARLVKAFNSMTTVKFSQGPRHLEGTRALFVSGDDITSKTIVMNIIKSFGFVPIDLGNLEDGGRLQQAGGPLAGPDFVIAD